MTVVGFAFIAGLVIGTTVGLLVAGLICAGCKDKSKDENE